MAGRPRKHFEKQKPIGFKVTPALDAAFREGAEARGLTLTDYLATLVAADRHRPDLAPIVQEVLPQTA